MSDFAGDIIHIETGNAKSRISHGGQVKVTTPDGREVHGVRKAVVTLEMHKAIRAELDLFCSFDGDVRGAFMVLHPVTGQRKQVKRVEFEDGTAWVAPEGKNEVKDDDERD